MQLSSESIANILPLTAYALLFAFQPQFVRDAVWLYWDAFRPGGLNPYTHIPVKPRQLLPGWIATTISTTVAATTITNLPLTLCATYVCGWVLWRVVSVALISRWTTLALPSGKALTHDLITFFPAGMGTALLVLSIQAGMLFFWCSSVLITLAVMRWLTLHLRVLLYGRGILQKLKNLIAITIVEAPLLALAIKFNLPQT